MTKFEEFQAKGTKETDKEISKILKKIIAVYTTLNNDIAELIKDTYALAVDDRTTPKTNLYQYLVMKGLYSDFIKRINKIYYDANRKVSTLIKRAMKLGFTNEYYRKLFSLQQVDNQIKFKKVPSLLRSLCILGTKKQIETYTEKYEDKYGPVSVWYGKYGNIDKLMKKHRVNELNRIESQILAGFSGNMKQKDLLSAIKQIIGYSTIVMVGEEQKRKAIGGLAASLKIANTNSMRAMNAGSYLSGLVSQTTMFERVWSAILDSATRPQSESMNGQVVGMDEPFIYPNGATAMYPGESGYAEYDVNDRCTVLERIKEDDGDQKYSWSEFDDYLDTHGLSKDVNGIFK